MADVLLIPLAAVYLLVVLLLFAFGINFYAMTWSSLRRGKLQTPVAKLPRSEWPSVTVQLPVYNEMYVVERLINAAAVMDYPPERLEIQVLDDSTDATVEIARSRVIYWQQQGVNIVHLHRTERRGYKAGALAAGLEIAQGEFLAIFDADFLPTPDFLRQVVPSFQDEKIAFVQARWGHVNQDYSLLTFLQSLSIDAHFMIEQFARSQAGVWFNFNGTAGAWRKQAILDAGGWTQDTLTEDLDLSYRAFLRGWNAIYLREVVVPAELPASINAYRRQQQRWARGSLQCAVRYIPRIWDSTNPLKVKIAATLHLAGYGVHLLLLALSILYPLILVLSQSYPSLVSLFGLALVFSLTSLAPTIFFISAQASLSHGWLRRLPLILFLSVVGCGMMVNTLKAAWGVINSQGGIFERTPKLGLASSGQSWLRLSRPRDYQVNIDYLVWIEIFLALVNSGTVIYAIHLHNWAIALYALLFAIGLFFVAGLSLWQSLALQRQNLPASLPLHPGGD